MNETNEALPSGLILLSQPEQLRITPKDMSDALPEAYKGLPRRDVDLDMAETARQAIQSRDWSTAQRTLEEKFRAELAPLLKRHSDYRVVYFGSSSIPLTVLLGFHLETWQQVEVIPHHHALRKWSWVSESSKPPFGLKQVKLPDFNDRTPGEAVIRVSTSHLVNTQATRRVVPDALVEIDIELEHPAEDAFSRLEEMQEVARAFREALDVIGDRFENIRRVHLFASVQPGMALLLGAQISQTMHPSVQTYQYARNKEDEPYHLPAILVNGPVVPEPLPLTEEEAARAQKDREQLARDVERMQSLASQPQPASTGNWLTDLLGRRDGHPDFSTHWLHLPALRQTPVSNTVDVETRRVEESFRLDASIEAWQVDDHWLARLAKRLPEEAKRQRALRMLVLHELAHRGPQALTSRSSREIGRFPKVVEEIDYHADVWGMLHEYALTRTLSAKEVADPRKFFMGLVEVATETMWAFNDGGPPLREIQIRRLNRYLIWYWQYLLLERGAGHGRETTLDFVLSLLAQRPIIELAGPPVIPRDERVFFELDSARVRDPELGIYHAGQLYRHGSRSDFSIQQLLQGVLERNGKKILEVLRSAFEMTVRSTPF